MRVQVREVENRNEALGRKSGEEGLEISIWLYTGAARMEDETYMND